MPRRRNTTAVQPLYYTIPDGCALLNLGQTKVYDLINREGLPTVKLGTARRVPIAKFHLWMEKRSASEKTARVKRSAFNGEPSSLRRLLFFLPGSRLGNQHENANEYTTCPPDCDSDGG